MALLGSMTENNAPMPSLYGHSDANKALYNKIHIGGRTHMKSQGDPVSLFSQNFSIVSDLCRKKTVVVLLVNQFCLGTS